MQNTMKRYGLGVLAGMLIVPMAWAGHLEIHNETGTSIRVLCGHDGHHGHTGSIHPNHHYNLTVNHHGGTRCVAKDHDGYTVETRRFHFDHHNNYYTWYVGTHHDA
ncbi:MAG TPA: hypothetical protein ENI80_08705 [Acidiferrobacteraceae bacterium]|nr:hypothetical protein [Acidiferrobacteraceae bacterium]